MRWGWRGRGWGNEAERAFWTRGRGATEAEKVMNFQFVFDGLNDHPCFDWSACITDCDGMVGALTCFTTNLQIHVFLLGPVFTGDGLAHKHKLLA